MKLKLALQLVIMGLILVFGSSGYMIYRDVLAVGWDAPISSFEHAFSDGYGWVVGLEILGLVMASVGWFAYWVNVREIRKRRKDDQDNR